MHDGVESMPSSQKTMISLFSPISTPFHHPEKLKHHHTMLKRRRQRTTAQKSRKAKYFETGIPPNFGWPIRRQNQPLRTNQEVFRVPNPQQGRSQSVYGSTNSGGRSQVPRRGAYMA